jgi:hypothetical protein
MKNQHFSFCSFSFLVFQQISSFFQVFIVLGMYTFDLVIKSYLVVRSLERLQFISENDYRLPVQTIIILELRNYKIVRFSPMWILIIFHHLSCLILRDPRLSISDNHSTLPLFSIIYEKFHPSRLLLFFATVKQD